MSAPMDDAAKAALDAARQANGEFGTQPKADMSAAVGDLTPPLRPVPLTQNDINLLRDNKGTFESGYDNDDAMSVLGQFESASMVVVWEHLDDGFEAGNSEFVGMEQVDLGKTAHGHQAYAAAGVWRRIHPQVWEYLSDPDSNLNPESMPSLLDDGEFAVFEDQDIEDKNFILNPDEEETCALEGCEESLDDNEGYDGYCGHHADKIAAHEDGEHNDYNGTDSDPDCPSCDHA